MNEDPKPICSTCRRAVETPVVVERDAPLPPLRFCSEACKRCWRTERDPIKNPHRESA